MADSLKAIFQKTSAKSANGVEDLFIKIGKRFLNPKGEETTGESANKNPKADNKENIKKKKKSSDGKPKKGCC